MSTKHLVEVYWLKRMTDGGVSIDIAQRFVEECVVAGSTAISPDGDDVAKRVIKEYAK